jgi:sigma-E factor negative regulatory protein RseA
MNPRQQPSSNSMASQRGLAGDASLLVDTNVTQRSWISELADGEDTPTEVQWSQLQSNAESRQDWALYQLIGDALRSSELAAVKPEFSSKVMAALEAEPVVLAPKRRNVRTNTAAFRRWIMPSMAVAAAAATVVWIAVPQLSDSRVVAAAGKLPAAKTTTVATITAPASTAVIPAAASMTSTVVAPAVADPLSLTSMERYLIAHQQVSPSASRHGMAPMVRVTTVSSESR